MEKSEKVALLAIIACSGGTILNAIGQEIPVNPFTQVKHGKAF